MIKMVALEYLGGANISGFLPMYTEYCECYSRETDNNGITVFSLLCQVYSESKHNFNSKSYYYIGILMS